MGFLCFQKKQLVDQGISEDEAWCLFLQIVDALADMSTHIVLHRDIKSTSIFIGELLLFPFATSFIVADTAFFF